MTFLFLKVLDENMQSCNGGKLRWKLNKWYAVKGNLEMCSKGLHLTTDPTKWEGQRIFIAETDKIYGSFEDKRLCRRVRLLKELSQREVKVYDEAVVSARKVYNEAVAPARKVYDEAVASAEKVY